MIPSTLISYCCRAGGSLVSIVIVRRIVRIIGQPAIFIALSYKDDDQDNWQQDIVYRRLPLLTRPLKISQESEKRSSTKALMSQRWDMFRIWNYCWKRRNQWRRRLDSRCLGKPSLYPARSWANHERLLTLMTVVSYILQKISRSILWSLSQIWPICSATSTQAAFRYWLNAPCVASRW